jgi:transketolase
MVENQNLQEKAINTIRFLSADAVQQANSGHPGLPMGAAAMAYTIWTRHLRINPSNPSWFNRDRFILSGGHGSMLLYSLLYLSGYKVSLDDLKQFRQWGSITPGHPEYGLTPGVDTTTGPLGQGFANGVGMAMAEAHLAATFNKPEFNLIDHYTYAIVTDGDLMEGISGEAASLAGHLSLGKLIYLYDNNHISIEGSTDIAFTEDRGKRFEAYGWQVLLVEDGNNVDLIDEKIKEAKKDPRPSIIICNTQIGYGMPNRQNTSKAHGEAPGEEELKAAKINLGYPVEPKFYVDIDVLKYFRQALERGQKDENEWTALFENYKSKYIESGSDLERRIIGNLPLKWDENLVEFPADPKGMATRASSGKVINALAAKIPELWGGSADLAPSTNTWIQGSPSFQPTTAEGRNLQFGVREHAMSAIVNGMAYHKGLISFGATFLVFFDYCHPSVRLAALSHLQSIWVFTHDSIGVGEDGPTHEPVEHVAVLRAIPNLVSIRPGDANEALEAWKVAIKRKNGPTVLVLSRQNMATLDRTIFNSASGLNKGAYVLADLGKGTPDIILMASGSEVGLIVEAGHKLAAEGKCVRLVSFPSWQLFAQQDKQYQESVLPKSITRRISVEAATSFGWERWVGDNGRMIAIDHFGASAPAPRLFQEFGFTVDHIMKTASELF